MNRVQCVAFGKQWEQELKPLCEQIIDQPLKKTANEYDTMDFESDDFWVELKVRSGRYYPSQFSQWLLPYCKIQRAMEEKKTVVFVYYWTATKQMFIIQYDKQVFDGFRVDVPEWKQDKQLQVYVPRELWEEIEIV